MSMNVLFSKLPPHVSEEEFATWYQAHLEQEMLEVPGMISAQLFKLDTEVGDPNGPVPFTYAVVYEVEGSWAEATKNLEKARLGNLDQYFERKNEDPSVGPPIPDWFTDIEWGWWNGVPLSGTLVGASKG